MEKGGFFYIMGSLQMTLYCGITSWLEYRVGQHKTKALPGFTAKYNVDRLLYHEQFGDIRDAIAREKEVKKWRREKKLRLIEEMNPDYHDLASGWWQEIARHN